MQIIHCFWILLPAQCRYSLVCNLYFFIVQYVHFLNKEICIETNAWVLGAVCHILFLLRHFYINALVAYIKTSVANVKEKNLKMSNWRWSWCSSLWRDHIIFLYNLFYCTLYKLYKNLTQYYHPKDDVQWQWTGFAAGLSPAAATATSPHYCRTNQQVQTKPQLLRWYDNTGLNIF